MRAVNIKDAKARLNELVEAAQSGEEVVLMRGSEHVAAIIPISAADLQLAPRLSDAQAERLWAQIAHERKSGAITAFQTPEAAVEQLARPPAPGKRKRRREPG